MHCAGGSRRRASAAPHTGYWRMRLGTTRSVAWDSMAGRSRCCSMRISFQPWCHSFGRLQRCAPITVVQLPPSSHHLCGAYPTTEHTLPLRMGHGSKWILCGLQAHAFAACATLTQGISASIGIRDDAVQHGILRAVAASSSFCQPTDDTLGAVSKCVAA